MRDESSLHPIHTTNSGPDHEPRATSEPALVPEAAVVEDEAARGSTVEVRQAHATTTVDRDSDQGEAVEGGIDTTQRPATRRATQAPHRSRQPARHALAARRHPAPGQQLKTDHAGEKRSVLVRRRLKANRQVASEQKAAPAKGTGQERIRLHEALASLPRRLADGGDMLDMALAVASPFAFLSLRAALVAQAETSAPRTDIFSDDVRAVSQALDFLEQAGNWNCYHRRAGIARLASIVARKMASKRTRTSKEQVLKTQVYEEVLAESGCPFPEVHRGERVDRQGLLEADTSPARAYNRRKLQLRRRLHAGNRWLRLVDRYGWLTLCLIEQHWKCGDTAEPHSDSR